MIGFINSLNFYIISMCDKSSTMQIMLIVKIFFKMLCIFVPIIIIIATIINLMNAINSGKEDDLKSNFSMLIRRIIAGLIIFFLPNIISFVFTNIVIADDVDFITCFESASIGRVKSLRDKEEAQAKADAKAQESEDEKILRAAYEKEQREKNSKKQSYENWKKEKEEEERKQQEQNSSGNSNNGSSGNGNSGSNSGTGDGGGSIISDVSPGTLNIIIGDSRTVGMCASITGDWSKCQYSNGGKNSGSDFYIAQGSMGFSWFNSTAVPAVNSILARNPNTKYNIYSLMGVNHLLSEIDKYIPTYNSLATGEWKNHKIILVSVGPVNEEVEAQNGYSTKNVNIERFNNMLRNGVRQSNVSYCDIYTPLGRNFGTGDGLHYTGDTYKKIYNLMKQC